MRIAFLLMAGLAGAVSAGASNAAGFDCVRERSGSCPSWEACADHPSATFLTRISLAETAAEPAAGAHKGTLQVCDGGRCGQVWNVEARRDLLGNWRVSHVGTETYLIDRETGFYTHTQMMNGSERGRIDYSFGKCVFR